MGLANPQLADVLRSRADPRAINLERATADARPNDPSALDQTADPYGSLGAKKVALDREPHLVYGRIVEEIAYTHCYKVLLDRGGGVIPCSVLVDSSLGVWGSRKLNTFVSGTAVWVLLGPHASNGVIIGAVPDWMISPVDALSDQVVQGSNVGLNIDAVHSFPFSLNLNGGITDWSAGRPTDSIPAGEAGWITDTGLMIFLDPTMVAIRVDEETGIFGFWDDGFLRVAGHSLQMRAAGYEHELKDDQEEFDTEEGYTPYLYEARGAWDTETTLYAKNEAQAVQVDTPWYSAYEPAQDDQQAIRRFRTYHGYLGQGEKKILFVPPVGTTEGLEQYPNQSLYVGVAEENWALDGTIGIRSAKAVVLSKRMMIPTPKRLKQPEDPTGDNDTNYKANGIYGEGPEHFVGDFEEPPENPDLVKGAAFLDYYTYLFNWKGLHPFYYHELDWYMPDESDEDIAADMEDGNPPFADLATSQYLPTPDPVQLYVDQRYNNVNYYPNDSFLALTEDGNLQLADGHGFELRTQNGSAFLTMPGDFFVLTGRDMYSLAGRNAVIRANDCIDLASNSHDVRIKADEKVLIVGGNDLCGGVLIESKSPAVAFDLETDDEVVGGIILRAKETAIVIYGQQIDLVLSDDGDGPDAITRSIILDAGHFGTVIQHGQFLFNRAEMAIQDVLENGGVPIVNEYWADNALISTPFRVNGDTFINGCLTVSGKVISGDFIVGNGFSQTNTDNFTEIALQQTDLTNRETDLFNWALASLPDTTRIQVDTDVLLLQFFYRDSDQCGIDSWLIPETRWQQMARLQDAGVETWVENPLVAEVAFPGVNGYPPPGEEVWAETPSYMQQDLNLFQSDMNLAEDRGEPDDPDGSPYVSPEYATPNIVVLDGNLPVIINPS